MNVGRGGITIDPNLEDRVATGLIGWDVAGVDGTGAVGKVVGAVAVS